MKWIRKSCVYNFNVLKDSKISNAKYRNLNLIDYLMQILIILIFIHYNTVNRITYKYTKDPETSSG